MIWKLKWDHERKTRCSPLIGKMQNCLQFSVWHESLCKPPNTAAWRAPHCCLHMRWDGSDSRPVWSLGTPQVDPLLENWWEKIRMSSSHRDPPGPGAHPLWCSLHIPCRTSTSPLGTFVKIRRRHPFIQVDAAQGPGREGADVSPTS